MFIHELRVHIQRPDGSAKVVRPYENHFFVDPKEIVWIHFKEKARELLKEHGGWQATIFAYGRMGSLESDTVHP